MKPFRFWGDRLFLLGCTAYAVNRWALKPHFHTRFLQGYFNDLWLIPCALPLLLWLHQKLELRSHGPPTAGEILGHLAVWSILFEWWGPALFPRATGDWLDVACYWIGGALAWIWWNCAGNTADRVADEL